MRRTAASALRWTATRSATSPLPSRRNRLRAVSARATACAAASIFNWRIGVISAPAPVSSDANKRLSSAMRLPATLGGFRSEVQPRRQHWFLNEKSGFPFRTPAFCSVSRGQRRLGEKEYRAPSVTPGVALRDRTQAAFVDLHQGPQARPALRWADPRAIADRIPHHLRAIHYRVQTRTPCSRRLTDPTYTLSRGWTRAWTCARQRRFEQRDINGLAGQCGGQALRQPFARGLPRKECFGVAVRGCGGKITSGRMRGRGRRGRRPRYSGLDFIAVA